MTLRELRPVPGYPGYEITREGRIWSALRQDRQGQRIGGRWMKSHNHNKYGHRSVCLSINGRRYWRYVHRLVLETFVGPCPLGMECCHNNGNPADNRLENLRWDTQAENMNDKLRHYAGRGERLRTYSKVTELDVRWIRYLRKAGMLIRDLAEGYHITESGIKNITSNRVWKYI